MCEVIAIPDVSHPISPMRVRFGNHARRWQRPSPRRIGRIGCGCAEAETQTGKKKCNSFI